MACFYGPSVFLKYWHLQHDVTSILILNFICIIIWESEHCNATACVYLYHRHLRLWRLRWIPPNTNLNTSICNTRNFSAKRESEVHWFLGQLDGRLIEQITWMSFEVVPQTVEWQRRPYTEWKRIPVLSSRVIEKALAKFRKTTVVPVIASGTCMPAGSQCHILLYNCDSTDR